ncbi:hypothetical protein [Paenibacillus sambharensis]|nr:hypothetical protein [Paenibacillus sambharensis]
MRQVDDYELYELDFDEFIRRGREDNGLRPLPRPEERKETA